MVNQAEDRVTTNPLNQILQILAMLPPEKLTVAQDYLRFLQANPLQNYHTIGSSAAYGQEPNNFAVLLTKQANNGYLARPLSLPEITVAGKDEAEALTRVTEAIVNLQSQSRIVHITIPATNGTPAVADDPMLRFAGMWADDPNWEQFQEDVASFRTAVDAHTDPDLLPLPE